MLSGSDHKERTEPAMGGGLWFHYQLIRLQQPSVARFPLEARKSILQGRFGGRGSVTTLMDMQHLHLNVRTFCLSVQLEVAVWPQKQCALAAIPKKSHLHGASGVRASVAKQTPQYKGKGKTTTLTIASWTKEKKNRSADPCNAYLSLHRKHVVQEARQHKT